MCVEVVKVVVASVLRTFNVVGFIIPTFSFCLTCNWFCYLPKWLALQKDEADEENIHIRNTVFAWHFSELLFISSMAIAVDVALGKCCKHF